MSVELALRLWKLPRPRVLVLGDGIVDVDYRGRCERFAAEGAGAPVFAIDSFERRDGGAGAVRAMAEGLGAHAVLSRAPSVSRKYRYFADGKLLFRADRDAPPLTPGEEENLARSAAASIAGGKWDVLLISDYGKGACTEKVLRAAIDGARAANVPCIVDPHAQRDWRRYEDAVAIKCNRREFENVENEGYGNRRTVVTCGAVGLFWNGSDGSCVHARSRRLLDPTGAGDAVLAALGVCIAGGMDWPDACRVAVAASGLKVERRGAVPVGRAEVVLDLLHPDKLLPAGLLAAVRAAADARGKKVAFANGCFDLLHAGHLHLLRQARQTADVLVVGLNDDDSIRRLKGPGRPVVPLAERAAILAALECVDWVVPFAGDTPVEPASILRPDVLVKGSDWRGKDVAGAEHAGEVRFVERLPGVSTTGRIDDLESLPHG